MSKILCVLRSKPLLLNIQISSVDLSCVLCKRFESFPTAPGLHNAQEAPKIKLGKLAEQIEEILQRQKEGGYPGSEHLKTITESLGLKSSQEFLSEFIALEKERQKAKDNNTQISEIVDLMSHIRGFLVKQDNFNTLNGIQIPSYFRCPLSFEIMSDPVIVASGQTYERTAIQKWLDHGLEKCPKTGNTLSHKNLIPNHTVKALIGNWCSENRIELFGTSDKSEVGSVQLCSEKTAHETRNSTSQSSPEVGRGLRTRSVNVTPGREDGYCSLSEKLNQSSPDYSYVHSRSESESSAVSSTDYLPTTSTEVSRISGKPDDDVSDRSGDITAKPTSSCTQVSRGAASLSAKPYSSSKTMAEMEKRNPPRTLSFSSEPGANDSTTTTSHVEKLIDDLKSSSTELQTAAAAELRFLAKYNMENRSIIGQCGAIGPLISLLRSEVEQIQEHAVTSLLNLSINEQIKARIAEEGALEPLIHILRTGSASGKENAAAALFSISLIDEFRIKIGRSGAVKALVDLLGSGTVRGKKDAATALFNLSIFHDNKARIIQAGAVKYLVELMDPESELVDKAVAVLANLSTVTEGCTAIARERGIPSLVEIVETGSQRGKENAASILLQMCINSPKHCQSVLQEGVVPPLVALSQSGTPRAKEKSQQLLSHFRNQRETAKTRGRS